MWWCFGFVVLCWAVRGGSASLAEEMAEATQVCCSQGTAYARNHTSEDCSSSAPPEVPGHLSVLCLYAMDQCCKEYFQKKRDCDSGTELAANEQRCDSAGASVQGCCEECARGRAAAAGGPAACKARARGDSAEELLATDAFTQCCQKAASERPTDEQPNTGPRSGNPSIISQHVSSTASTNMASLCEEYAPTELCAHHCIPVPGAYKCECNPGFMLMADGRNCMEVVKNRCKPYNPCQYKCNDNGIELKCSCRRGFKLRPDGKTCEDIDECALDPPVCLPNTVCNNTEGSYKCFPVKQPRTNLNDKGDCPPGYLRNINNNVCDDVNECALMHPPCPAYLCENTIGGYKCGGASGDPSKLAANDKPVVDDRCPIGFHYGYNEECEDVDECALKKDDCNPLSQFCINTRGSFYCQNKVSKHCPPGFKINVRTNKCEDIDECEEASEICRADQVCVNVPGEYDCRPKDDFRNRPVKCPDGMRMKLGGTFCEDIDECAEGTHLCDQHQSCLNTNGSHECHCKVGFELDPITGACTDQNECASEQNDCIVGSQRCDNTVGSYICIRITPCGTGYILHHTRSQCEDIDECALGTHNCARAGPEYHCENHPGTFRCVKKRPSTTSTTAAPEYEYYYDSEEEEGNETRPAVNSTASKSEPPTTTTPESPPPSEAPTTPSTRPTDPLPPYEPPQSPSPNFIDSRFNNVTPKKPYEEPIPTQPIYNEPTQPTEPRDISSEQPYYPKPPEYPRQPEYPRENEQPREPEPSEYPRQPDYPRENEQPRDPEPSEYPRQPDYPRENEQPREPEPQRPKEEPQRPREYEPRWPKQPESERPKEFAPQMPREPEPYRPRQPESDRPMKFEPDAQRPIDYDQSNTRYDISTERANSEISPEAAPSPAETTYRSEASPTPPQVVYVSVGKETATVEGEKRNDGSVIVHTKELPKNEWTKVNSKPSKCNYGFEADERGVCVDIDECATGRDTCLEFTELCRNTEGGYLCDCARGYRRSAVNNLCDAIGSPAQAPPTTPPPPPLPSSSSTTERTRNTFWGYKDYRQHTVRPFRPRNQCDSGFRFNSQSRECEDINECINGQANCASVEICLNTKGGYRCECPPNWTLDDVRHRCVPVRNAGQFPQGYGNEPVYPQNQEDIYHVLKKPQYVEPEIKQIDDRASVMICPGGYKLGYDGTCVDVNECATGEASCEGMLCTNLPGAYVCNCPPGHKQIHGKKQCVDVDECSLVGNMPICSQNADCVNTVGSYQCRCHNGFRSAPVNDKVCVDVDECTESSYGSLCQHRCNNVWGGYRCSCHQGYRLNSDNSTCSDIDECSEFKTVCIGRCVNEPGSYRCTCPTGYRLSEDKRSCIDIDECETGEAPCAKTGTYGGTSDVCLNMRGGYHCHRVACPQGYKLESRHRCTKIQKICPPSDWECAHQPTTYSYNFITFISKLDIPDSKVDLFTMRGPAWRDARMKFQLRLLDVNAPPTVKDRADISAFLLTQTGTQAVMSLVRSLEGPQSIELELSMDLYSGEQFGGIAVAKVYIYVSEYDF